MAIPKSKLLLSAVGVVLLYLLLAFGWAARPLHDSVPVGTDWAPTVLTPPKPQQLVSQEVRCNSVFASSPRGSEPLPSLTPQPKGQPALDYQRPPCVLVQSNARTVFVIDTLFAIGVLALIGAVAMRRRGADDEVDEPDRLAVA